MKTKYLPVAVLAALFLPPFAGAPASILGSAGDFTILGGTAVTSSGTVGTVIKNGNVGLFPAATSSITGFPPAVIENGSIVATGPTTAQARQDLIKAQAGIAAIPADANISNVDLGGQTLVPGVYKFNADANLTGTVVLDAQGRNNVFWVFQIGTALTTANNASVTIINPGTNGGSDDGIFWNCGTAINVGANNQIAGIYLAGTSIVFGANSTRGGRALALAGITLDNNQIDATGGPGGGDYSGGLMFDDNGNVVPLKVATTDAPLFFRYFGQRKRSTHAAIRVIKGDAISATTVQWRTHGRKWHSAPVQATGSWHVKIRNLTLGMNKVRLRALSAGGASTAIKRLAIIRL